VSSLGGCVVADVFNTNLGSSFAFNLSDPKFAPLNEVGSAVDVDDAAGRPIILIRVDEEQIMAVNRICTHSQCDMKFGRDGKWENGEIICLCHNSKFDPTGAVIQGPATRPLTAYSVEFTSGQDEAQILFTAEEPEVMDLVNPFEGDEDAITQGEQLYQQNCVFCHGEGGAGEVLPGADAFAVDQSTWTNTRLFNALNEGIDGTSMPAFGESLTEDERWQVISYIRSLRTDN
jgi:Rieske Fe-S protein